MYDLQRTTQGYSCHIRDPPGFCSTKGGDRNEHPVRGPPKKTMANYNVLDRRSRVVYRKLPLELLLKLLFFFNYR